MSRQFGSLDLRSGISLRSSQHFGSPALKNDSLSYLFKNGEQGVLYEPSDISTLFIDAAGTIPVTGAGDPVGLMLDKSGNDLHARQPISAYRPIYKIDANGKPYLESRNGGYMNINSPLDFLVDQSGATLAMAFGKFTDDLAVVIGNSSVRLQNNGFDIYFDNRDVTNNPMLLNHTNPYDGAPNNPLLSNMISGTQPYVINYRQTVNQNSWGSTLKPLEFFTNAGRPNGQNMVILAAGGVNGVKFPTKTPNFYGAIIVNKVITNLTEINAYLLSKMGDM